MSEQPVFVGRLMTNPARTVGRETTLEAAATKLDRHGLGSAVVVDQDTRLEGIITRTDFVAAASAGVDPATTTVGEYLTTDVVTTAADEPAVDAARRMRTANVNHLPVVDDNDGIVGMLTSTDLADYLAREGVPTPPADDTADDEEEATGEAADDTADDEEEATGEATDGTADDPDHTTAGDTATEQPGES